MSRMEDTRGRKRGSEEEPEDPRRKEEEEKPECKKVKTEQDLEAAELQAAEAEAARAAAAAGAGGGVGEGGAQLPPPVRDPLLAALERAQAIDAELGGLHLRSGDYARIRGEFRPLSDERIAIATGEPTEPMPRLSPDCLLRASVVESFAITASDEARLRAVPGQRVEPEPIDRPDGSRAIRLYMHNAELASALVANGLPAGQFQRPLRLQYPRIEYPRMTDAFVNDHFVSSVRLANLHPEAGDLGLAVVARAMGATNWEPQGRTGALVTFVCPRRASVYAACMHRYFVHGCMAYVLPPDQ